LVAGFVVAGVRCRSGFRSRIGRSRHRIDVAPARGQTGEAEEDHAQDEEEDDGAEHEASR
jgi:hypothetical protein